MRLVKFALITTALLLLAASGVIVTNVAAQNAPPNTLATNNQNQNQQQQQQPGVFESVKVTLDEFGNTKQQPQQQSADSRNQQNNAARTYSTQGGNPPPPPHQYTSSSSSSSMDSDQVMAGPNGQPVRNPNYYNAPRNDENQARGAAAQGQQYNFHPQQQQRQGPDARMSSNSYGEPAYAYGAPSSNQGGNSQQDYNQYGNPNWRNQQAAQQYPPYQQPQQQGGGARDWQTHQPLSDQDIRNMQNQANHPDWHRLSPEQEQQQQPQDEKRNQQDIRNQEYRRQEWVENQQRYYPNQPAALGENGEAVDMNQPLYRQQAQQPHLNAHVNPNQENWRYQQNQQNDQNQAYHPQNDQNWQYQQNPPNWQQQQYQQPQQMQPDWQTQQNQQPHQSSNIQNANAQQDWQNQQQRGYQQNQPDWQQQPQPQAQQNQDRQWQGQGQGQGQGPNGRFDPTTQQWIPNDQDNRFNPQLQQQQFNDQQQQPQQPQQSQQQPQQQQFNPQQQQQFNPQQQQQFNPQQQQQVQPQQQQQPPQQFNPQQQQQEQPQQSQQPQTQQESQQFQSVDTNALPTAREEDVMNEVRAMISMNPSDLYSQFQVLSSFLTAQYDQLKSSHPSGNEDQGIQLFRQSYGDQLDRLHLLAAVGQLQAEDQDNAGRWTPDFMNNEHYTSLPGTTPKARLWSDYAHRVKSIAKDEWQKQQDSKKTA